MTELAARVCFSSVFLNITHAVLYDNRTGTTFVMQAMGTFTVCNLRGAYCTVESYVGDEEVKPQIKSFYYCCLFAQVPIVSEWENNMLHSVGSKVLEEFYFCMLFSFFLLLSRVTALIT